MKKPDPLLFSIQQMTIDMSLIDRRHYLPHTSRRENDIEHSLTVAILCWYILDTHAIELNVAKVLKYALTHDFVERYAGDVPTFATKTERDEKVIREQESLRRLSEEFKGFNDLVVSMQKYEAKEDTEAQFVWSVDKMQQLIMGDLDNWRSYAEKPITYEEFTMKYSDLLKKSSIYTREIFEGLLEYSKTTYYDQPK